MRPLRLELEGFASFKEPTVIDFGADADLFVLTGPTGSGKSSVIDAIGFALYGSVARYGNENAVEPVICRRSQEAKVRFDFAVGEDRYTVVRVVRRTGKGATTKEARLEKNGHTANVNGARELDTEVEKLLGLTFDQFTKCVVLPQGEFARFLHEKVGPRREMLVRLVGAEFLIRIQQEANRRASVANASAAMCQARLDNELAGATAEALVEARERVSQLERLLASITADGPALQEIAERRAAAEAQARAATEAAGLLALVRTPEGVGELAERMRGAELEVARAEELLQAANDDRTAAEEARAAIEWTAEGIDHIAQLYRDLAKLSASREAAEEALNAAIAAEASAEADVRTAEANRDAAVERRQAVLNQNYAYALAQKLKAGDLCPVCGEKLAADPHHEQPEGMAEVTAARDEAEQAVKRAADALRRASGARSQRQAELSERTKQIAALEARLDGQPAEAELAELRAKVAAADNAVREASANARKAAQRQQAANAALSQERERASKAWTEFDKAFVAVAALKPPSIARDDLAAAWAALAGWAAAELPARAAAAEQARAAEQECVAEAERIIASQRERCAEAGLDVTHGDPRDSCVGAVSRAVATCDRIEEQIAEAARVRSELETHLEVASVAQTLAQCLKGDARGFPEWYVDQVLRRLVRDASQRLEQLSSGQYGLSLDASREFAVIDHTNADESRPIRTLSGGETFLASLALALALSDNLADMAANGAARLEAIFLDEGFGTLDPETLDVVAAALEELGTRGRMVGVVTHVPALAERMP
ncbi:MAG: AAA family ATPase, partial [Hyphomicrobiales bacterium]